MLEHYTLNILKGLLGYLSNPSFSRDRSETQKHDLHSSSKCTFAAFYLATLVMDLHVDPGMPAREQLISLTLSLRRTHIHTHALALLHPPRQSYTHTQTHSRSPISTHSLSLFLIDPMEHK